MLASNKMRFLLKVLIISIIFIGIFNIKSLAIVKPTSEFYVNDYANLLSTETKKYIMDANIKLQNQTGAQIVVVTVPNLEGRALEEYATELFRNFGIGDKSKNNGVLLLLALEERQFRVEVGYGLEGILPDGKTGRIQDEYIIPYLKQNNWNEGIKNGFSAILKEIEAEYNIDVGSEEAIISSYQGNEEDDFPTILMSMPMISALVGLILRNVKIRNNKKVIISILYICIIAIICYICSRTIGKNSILGKIISTIVYVIFNFIWLITAMFGRARIGGGYYSGRRLLRRRWRLL